MYIYINKYILIKIKITKIYSTVPYMAFSIQAEKTKSIKENDLKSIN